MSLLEIPEFEPQPENGDKHLPKHIGIIMDGNGRWAKARGLPRAEGHRRGVEALRRTLKYASELGVQFMTIYAFSSENWKRPQDEISDLMGLLRRFIRKDLAELHSKNVRIKIIGSQENLPSDIITLLHEARTLTSSNTGTTLVVAFNYGSRDEITRACRQLAKDVKEGMLDPDAISENTLTNFLDTHDIPDPDLIIRTSGEMRLSNFLMWQAAYSEFYFDDVLWPDYDKENLERAVHYYMRRERRYGGLGATA
jgi:undecaprenyl diphosphate synthase